MLVAAEGSPGQTSKTQNPLKQRGRLCQKIDLRTIYITHAHYDCNGSDLNVIAVLRLLTCEVLIFNPSLEPEIVVSACLS